MSIIKQFKKDDLNVTVFETRAEMGAKAGADAAEAIKKAISEKGFANVMFAAAPSQDETLAALCADTGIDWSKVHAFHMDEYIGLDETHPAGFRNYLRRAIFDRFEFASLNLLNGNAEPVEEAARYGKLLEEHPLDVCLCGIGENGHIAFNDPGVADFKDPVKVKIAELDSICRNQQVNDGCFACIDEVPTHALTVTVPGMTSAAVMICSVPAPTKARAAKHMLEDEISEALPATALRLHPDASLYLDRDAASMIL